MEVCNPKAGGRTAAPAFLPMLLMIMMLLINAYCCGAAVLSNSNTSFRCSGGRLDECLIEEDLELELGFLMNPYISRILTGGQEEKPQSGDPNKAAIACGKPEDNPSYSSCMAKIKNPNNKDCKKGSPYKRCGEDPKKPK